MAFKMKGHSLPGINQRKSPTKHRRTKSTVMSGEEASAHNATPATESHYGHPHGSKPEKKSPSKLLGIAGLTAAMIAKAAIGGAAGAAVSKGVGAIAKGSAKRKAEKKAAQEKAQGAMGQAGSAMGQGATEKKSSKLV
tara:strand:- start:917 stop:1330 length:414 start_codon:yes stop_codon:yes gene_type:complete